MSAMRSAALAAFALLLGCAKGGSAEGASPVDDAGDTMVRPDAASTDGDAITLDTRPSGLDGGDGSIFDAIDDSPCTPGAIRPCLTTCGTTGDATCLAGDLGPCKPRAGDPCSGIDCIGKGDGFEHTFYRDVDGDGYGDATKTVQGCLPTPTEIANKDDCDDGRSAVHPGATEVCDKLDNDCNGKTDEGVHVLAVNVPYGDAAPCTLSEASHAACKQGAAAWCRARSSCYDGGFGPVELGPTEGQFICISGGTLTGTWAEVTSAQPACSADSQAGLRVCESAVHRAGANAGYASAILQTHSPGDWRYLALGAERAKVYGSLLWSDLTSQHGGCYDGRQDSWDCNAASHRYCQSKGHESGYGPVEYNTANVAVVCVNK